MHQHHNRLILIVATAIAFVVVTSSATRADECAGGASSVDTLSVSLALDTALGGTHGSLSWEVEVLLTSNGTVEYAVSAKDLGYSGLSTAIDSMSTPAIFTSIAHATVGFGVRAGHSVVSTDTSAPTIITVRHPSCVQRQGTGPTTSFAACTWGCAARRYAASVNSNGELELVLLDIDSPGCNEAGCDSTIPTSGNGGGGSLG